MSETRINYQTLRSEGLQVNTGEAHRIIVILPDLVVYLPIDPRDPGHHDTRFVLEGVCGPNQRTQTRTVADNCSPQSDGVELTFRKLHPNYRYSLFVESGDGSERYAVFTNRDFDELFS